MTQQRILELEMELARLRAEPLGWRKTGEVDTSFWTDGGYVYRVCDTRKATVPADLVAHIEAEATKNIALDLDGAERELFEVREQLEEAAALLNDSRSVGMGVGWFNRRDAFLRGIREWSE